MKPSFSIIFFTVSSGAGLGLLALLALADLCPVQLLPSRALDTGIALALALVVVGLASSGLHLAKPSNAWRTFSQFRTSWLSREAVLAAALCAVAVGYGGGVAAGVGGSLRVLLGALAWSLSCAVLFCTAMIYASLKPIRQWHTRWTPANYLLLGHWSGAVLLLGIARAYAANVAPFAWLTGLIGLAALVVKLAYWRAVRGERGTLTLERAIGVREGVRPPGVTVAQARLFDAGHSHGTFLTDAAARHVVASIRAGIGIRCARRVDPGGHARRGSGAGGGFLYHGPAGRALAVFCGGPAHGPALPRRCTDLTRCSR